MNNHKSEYVQYDTRLTPFARVLYAEIVRLSRNEPCRASDAFLAQNFNVSERTINRSVGLLFKFGHVQKWKDLRHNLRFLKPTIANGECNNGVTTSQKRTDIYKGVEHKMEHIESKERASFNQIIFEYTKDPRLRQLLGEYVQMRVMRRNAPTNAALKLILSRLTAIGGDLCAIVEQSLVNGWGDFYPPKSPPKPPPKSEMIRHEHSEKDLSGLVKSPKEVTF